MRKPKHPLLETRRERIDRGERELMGVQLFPSDMQDPPEEFEGVFFGTDISTKNTYNMARWAAKDVVNLFQQRLFDWLEENWCRDCPHREEGKTLADILQPEQDDTIEAQEVVRRFTEEPDG